MADTDTTEENTAEEKKPILLGHIYGAIPAFEKVRLMDKPPMLSYRLNKYFKENIAPEMQSLEPVRIELCEKYGTYDKSSNTYNFTKQNQVIFNKEFNKLLSAETKVEPVDITILSLVQALDSSNPVPDPKSKEKPKKNVISEDDIMKLEIFFKPL